MTRKIPGPVDQHYITLQPSSLPTPPQPPNITKHHPTLTTTAVNYHHKPTPPSTIFSNHHSAITSETADQSRRFTHWKCEIQLFGNLPLGGSLCTRVFYVYILYLTAGAVENNITRNFGNNGQTSTQSVVLNRADSFYLTPIRRIQHVRLAVVIHQCSNNHPLTANC